MRLRRSALVLALAQALVSCGGAPPVGSNAGALRTRGKAGSVGAPRTPGFVTPSRLLPDLVGDRGVVGLEDGHRRVLVDRMRLIAHEDGTLERAAELLPPGKVDSVPLPTRLGGGYVFFATSGAGTQIWRAPSWLGKLKPLLQLGSLASDVVPGFDRLYVRLQSTGALRAYDAETGAPLPLAPLPPAAAYGPLAFADGWRAVVDTDLRGPLATFDAGLSWRPVGIKERPLAIFAIRGDPVITVQTGVYTVDARGAVGFRPLEPIGLRGETPPPGTARDEGDPPSRAPGPLGRRPLRAAVEDGWPDSDTTAVVARSGVLARVALRDGAVLDTVEDAYRERQATCHGVRLGPPGGAGFVCGERDGATVIYELVRPLAMREVMRFARPRFVSPSGNGALVVRGGCTDSPALLGDTRLYCIRAPSGPSREIRVRSQGSDLGVERVVALADGRVVVLVPPRPGASGQITVLAGQGQSSAALRMPETPRDAAREMRRGMWLDGFEEREPGVIGGWVEAGGPVVGIRIALDGKVTAGEVRQSGEEGALLSGRFALVLGQGGRATESTDGGKTWKDIDLPDRGVDVADSPTRACGVVGCALRGWIRVGWGAPATDGDLEIAEAPMPSTPAAAKSTALALGCEAIASSTPPLPPSGKAASPPPSPPSPGRPPRPMPPSSIRAAGWSPFRNTLPPALASDEVGFDNGAPTDTVAMRAYAWGRKGADWTRAGRWILRFDDRFDGAGGVRTSAVTASAWPDEATASDAIGSPMLRWDAFLDPSGRAALVQTCRGGGCALYAVADGQPILPVRDASGRSGAFARLSTPAAAVRSGETWFFMSPVPGAPEMLGISRVDLGSARTIATLPRPRSQVGASMAEAPRMVRRALGVGVGLLITTPPEPGRGASWYVYPLDADSGELGEPIPLGRKDLGGVVPETCGARQDGWALDTPLETTPSIDIASGRATLGSVELRLRLDPGTACVEGVSAVIDGVYTKAGPKDGTPSSSVPVGTPHPPGKPAEKATASSIPLSATERPTGRRWSFRCVKR